MQNKLKLAIIIFQLIPLLSSAQGDYIINEQFKNNKLNWVIKTKNGVKTFLTGGKYYMEIGTNQKYHYFATKVPIKTKKDFEIEAKINIMQSKSNSYNGLFWHDRTNDKLYCFLIHNKSFYINLHHGFNDIYIKGVTHCRYINTGSSNILTVRKTNNATNFYINRHLVHSAKGGINLGDACGFKLEQNSTVLADYLTVKAQKSNAKPVKKVAKTEAEAKPNKKNMGKNINSQYSEIAPVIAPDGKTLYVARLNHSANIKAGKYDIWYARLNPDGSWGKLQHAPKPLNNGGNNAIIAVAPDNNTLFLEGLYNADGSFKSSKGISVSYRTKTGWTIPRKLEIQDYENLDTYESYSISSDRQTLIMSVKQKGGYGKKDLWVSFLQADGTYSKPKNMGATLNSKDEEGTPYLAPDNKTLYYYSISPNGYGNADIFVSRRLDDSWTKWSKPENLGSEINSNAWDGYYTLDAKGKYAYLVSMKNTYGQEDIFSIKLQDSQKPKPVAMLKGKVLNKKNNKPVATDIFYYDLKTGKQAGIARSNPATGKYQIILPYGKNYEVKAIKDNYFALSEIFNLTEKASYKEINQDLLLIPKEQDVAIVLRNVNFDAGKAVLVSEAYAELNRLVRLMKDNPNLVIELQGHTEHSDGYEDKLMALSQRRVNTVKSFLVSKGISSDRIKGKAFGGTRPITSNATPQGRRKNRRVEFKVLQK